MSVNTLPPPLFTDDDFARARLDDPLTSHAAADSNTNKNLIRSRVYELLAMKPMTDDELTQAYFERFGAYTHPDSPRKRRSDLKKQGRVFGVGERLGLTGRKVTVWAVKPYV